MAILNNETPTRSFVEQAKYHFNKYGLIAIFLVILAATNGLLFWNVTMYMQRADVQLDITSRVGRLEGKMEMLEKNVCSMPTISPTSILPIDK